MIEQRRISKNNTDKLI